MGATTHVVHFGAGLDADALPPGHERVDLDGGADGPLGEAFDEDAAAAVFPDLELLAVGFEQVGYSLIIDLQVRCSDHKSDIIHAPTLYIHKYLLHRPWNNSPLRILLIILKSLHSERLPRPRLPIRQYSRVISL